MQPGRNTIIQENHTFVREPANREFLLLLEGSDLDVGRMMFVMVYDRLRGRRGGLSHQVRGFAWPSLGKVDT